MSHAAGVWSFPPPTERKLTAAVAASNVVVPFSVPLVAGLTNSFDEGRRLQTARDGQELDPASASALLQSMAVSPGQLSGVIERRGGRGGPHLYQQASRGWPDVSRRRARR